LFFSLGLSISSDQAWTLVVACLLFVFTSQAGVVTDELLSAIAILQSKDLILKHKPCCHYASWRFGTSDIVATVTGHAMTVPFAILKI